MATIPEQFRAGDFVTWTETEAPAGTTAITAYLRTNAASGAAITATSNGDGTFAFTISSTVTTGLLPGDYRVQFLATVGGQPRSYRESRTTVLRSLAFTGSATSIDLRSQLEKDLADVEQAIRVLVGGAQEYAIGLGTANGGRKVRRADLAELIKWRDSLRADLVKEQSKLDIANGKGNPNKLYVRFTSSY